MLNGSIKKVISLCLAFLVMASTMSFTINEHYCGGSLVDASWFGKAKTCMMEDAPSTSKNTNLTSDSCCKDVVTIVNGQSEVEQTKAQWSFNQQVFIASFYYSYRILLAGIHDKVIPFKDYTPPLVVKDIHMLDEVYLM